MNRSYRLIWSRVKEAWLVVAETINSRSGLPSLVTGVAVLIVAALCGSLPASALDPAVLPTGGQVVAGSGSISQNGSTMTVTQGSQRMIANWSTFNIGQNATVSFLQPNAAAVALNRIQDQNPSQIFGSLSANGQVWLLNPAGIIFGATSRVDVGGLVASSLNITNENFLAGKNIFEKTDTAGAVLNQGTIRTADGGYVAFMAPQVVNEGSIASPKGTVALAAGNKVTLDFAGDGLLKYTVDQGAVDALVENKGLIKADGGLVMMTARAADSLTSAMVNNSGIVEAQTLENKAGRILLDTDGGMTTVNGTLDVSSGTAAGGRMVVTGDRVLVKNGSHLTASGATGGGEVLVGGSWQNSDSSVRQATGTVIEQGALLEANATVNGNGGTVVAWSDVTNPLSVTRAYGIFEANGGPNGGNGGRIETSGHWLDAAGSQGGASAPFGTAGLWLFDPYNVTITTASANGGWSATNPDIWTPSATGSTILNTDINGKLNAGTSVTVTTTGAGVENGNITVDASINKTAGGDATLTLDAAGDVIFNANRNVTSTVGKLNVATLAGGRIMMNTNAWISSNGGNVLFNTNSGGVAYNGGSATIVLNGFNRVMTNGGNITFGGGVARDGSGYAVNSSAGYGGIGTFYSLADNLLDAGSGNITLRGQSIGSDVGVQLRGTTLQTIGSGAITLDGKTANNTFGIRFRTDASTLSTMNGNINLIGSASGTTATDYAIAFNVATAITSNSGTINLTSNGANIGQSAAVTLTGITSITAGTNNVDLNNAGNNFSGTVGVVSGNNVSLRDANSITLTASTISGNLSLTANGAIVQNGPLAVTGTTTLSTATSSFITLMNAGNDFTGAVTVPSVGDVNLVDSNAMTIGGIAASGNIYAETISGNLTVSGNVLTPANVSANAIRLVADSSKTAGDGTGGNIVIIGSPLISSSVLGRTTLYSGSVSGSSGVTTLVGSGSGNFRYNADEGTDFSIAPWTNLGIGKYAVYREQPALAITADNKTITYGTAPSLTTSISGLQNGDTAAQAFSTAAAVAVGGTTSTSGNYTAGAHSLTPSGAVVGLGYSLSYTAGALTVDKANLGLDLAGQGSKTYDGTTSISLSGVTPTLTGVVGADAVALGVGAVTGFVDKNVGASKPVTFSGFAIAGADVGNYNLTSGIAPSTANISPATLTVTANSKTRDQGTPNPVLDGTISGFVSGETQAVLATQPNYQTAATLVSPTGSYPITASGAAATNYTFVYQGGTLTINVNPQSKDSGSIVASLPSPPGSDLVVKIDDVVVDNRQIAESGPASDAVAASGSSAKSQGGGVPQQTVAAPSVPVVVPVVLPETLQLTTGLIDDPVEIYGNAEALKVAVNDREVPLPKGDVVLRSAAPDDVITYTGKELGRPLQFQVTAAEPAKVVSWQFAISLLDGRTVRSISGKGRPKTQLSWDGRDDQGVAVKGGDIYQYQLQVNYADGTSSASPLRRFGLNRSSLVTLSLSGNAFAAGSDTLSEKARKMLGDAATALKKYPEERILIEELSGAAGADKAGLELNRRRVDAAIGFLTAQSKIPDGRILVRWLGAIRPVAAGRIDVSQSLPDEFRRPELYEQGRPKSFVTLNSTGLPLDENGRFATRLPSSDEQVVLEMGNRDGRIVRKKISLPAVRLINHNEGDTVSGNATKASGRLAGKIPYTFNGTVSRNTSIMIDGKMVPVAPDGRFSVPLGIRKGENVFWVQLATTEGYSRYVRMTASLSSLKAGSGLLAAQQPAVVASDKVAAVQAVAPVQQPSALQAHPIPATAAQYQQRVEQGESALPIAESPAALSVVTGSVQPGGSSTAVTMTRLLIAEHLGSTAAKKTLARLKSVRVAAFLLPEGNGRFGVYAGSFRQEPLAEKERLRLAMLGISSRCTTAQLSVK